MKTISAFVLGALLALVVSYWRPPSRWLPVRGPSPRSESWPAGAAADRAGERTDAAGANGGRAASALRAALAERRLSGRYALLNAYFSSSDRAPYGEILRAIADLAVSPADRKILQNALFQRWVETDPGAAVQAFGQMSPTDKLNNIDALSYAWAAYDPAAALAWAEKLGPSQVRSSAVGHALAKLGETDMNAALARLQELDPSTARWAGGELYVGWAERDPKTAMAAAQNFVETGRSGDWAVQAVAATWARVDPAAALKWVTAGNTANSPLGMSLAAAVVATAGAIDPRVTVETIWDQAGTPQADALRVMAMRSWLEQDGTAATQWLNGVEAATRTQFVLAASRLGDGASASTWLPIAQDLPPSAARTQALQNLVTQWATVQPENAVRYLQGLNEPGLTSALMPNVAMGLAATDPESALTLALDLPQNPARRDALVAIAGAWAAKNPAQAVQRLDSIAAGADQNLFAASIARTWASSDPNAATNWAQALPPGAARDSSLEALAGSLRPSYPELALNAAAAISNPAQRENTVVTQARAWLRADPVPASKWIRASLSPALQQTIFTPNSNHKLGG